MYLEIEAALHRFTAAEDGAVSVEYVVLTAAIIGLSLAFVGHVRNGSEAIAEVIEEAVEETDMAGMCPSGCAEAGGGGGSGTQEAPPP